jgi:3-hydroxyisobutyrate dehydrogenase-like beta-hydroxyacid dehydrogenase
MGQVYVFGEKSGVDAPYLGLMMKTMFPQPQLQEYAERIQARHFEPAGFAVTGGLKDVDLFLKAAGDVGVALPYANIVRDKLLTAVAHGMGQRDWSAIYEVSRLQAGLD